MMTLSPHRFDYTFEDYFRYLEGQPKNACSMRKVLESCIMSDQAAGRTFLRLVDAFLREGGDPNLSFPEFQIGENTFRNVTFFQIVYLNWKASEKNWNERINAEFEQTVDRMLSDERTDVRAKFTEHVLFKCEHFFNKNREEYHRQREEEGYLLEGATIAHYAIAIEDFEMADKVLRKAPDLLDATCCLMRGKNLLHEQVSSVAYFFCDEPANTNWWGNSVSREVECILFLGDNDAALETITGATETINVSLTRSTNVSLMHLAARHGDAAACGFFRGQRANFVARDSNGFTPFDYLKLSIAECFIPENSSTKRLMKVLEPVTRLNKPLLPESYLLLKKEGYWIMYDPRTRIAHYVYERLTKASLEKNAGRAAGGSFKVDHEVPELNRGKGTDYTKSGYDKGHLRPAANAPSSNKAMEDTFLFSNAYPQKPSLNRGYWKKFEGYIRQLIADHDLIEVFTGALFLANNNTVTYQTIGAGRTAVPTHFYKVLYLYKGLNKRAEAYILPNAPIPKDTPYTNFLCRVDRVQELAGILFNSWRSWE